MRNTVNGLKSVKHQLGIGLIEVLIAALILAVGVAAVTKVQGDLFTSSSESKARAEALAIASARIEEMRNYTNAVADEDAFKNYFKVAADTNQRVINGTNASFTRTETLVANGDARNVTVKVTWAGQLGATQEATLNTLLSYASPKGPGITEMDFADPIVAAPTGRAELGKGTAPSVDSDNDDGTGLYDSQDGDLNLVVGDNNKIVLTLRDACDASGGNCTDFVKISGRVYIDLSTQGSLKPGEVYVQASDAAYCTRYYFDPTAGATDDGGLPLGGNVVVSTATTVAELTANGDYKYFNYTCYLGGGWHGNIGLLFAGGVSQQDKVCMGDPVSANLWEQPVIGTRRAYRGMIYPKLDPNDANAEKIYESYGIADATSIPAAGEHGHDFVVGKLSASSLDGSYCVSAGLMTRTDANINGTDGDLFEGNPEDFVCLNDGLLDAYDTTTHTHDTVCPYDPTDPPISRYIVSGNYNLDAEESDANTLLFQTIGFLTSDGWGNCRWVTDEETLYTGKFGCQVFDWDETDVTGWDGLIYGFNFLYKDQVSCSPNSHSFTNLNGNSAGNDVTCTVVADGGEPKSPMSLSGTVTAPNKKELISITSNVTGFGCSSTIDGLSYNCISDPFAGTSSYTATLSTAGYLCPAQLIVGTGSVFVAGGDGGGVMTVSNMKPDSFTLNLTIVGGPSQADKCPAL